MKKRKIPLRKCIACNQSKQKKELIRVVKTKDNYLDVDLTGKINGRGAYICRNKECFKIAEENNKIAKAFKMEIPDEIYDKLNNIIDFNKDM